MKALNDVISGTGSVVVWEGHGLGFCVTLEVEEPTIGKYPISQSVLVGKMGAWI